MTNLFTTELTFWNDQRATRKKLKAPRSTKEELGQGIPLCLILI